MEEKRLKEMFDNLLHIGNKTNHWNPRMKQFIYGSTNGVHIINLVKTSTQIDLVKEQLGELTTSGKKVLFVATKLQARDGFRKLAENSGHYYVCEKWVPGLLTNFKTIRKRINTYLKLLKDSEVGALDILTKKEKAAKLLELEKLDKAFHGLKEMKKVPDVLVVIDGSYESQAIKEANTLKIPCFAISNTNGSTDNVTDVIPANTNSVKSLDYLAQELTSAMKTPAAKKSGTRVTSTTQKVSGTKKVAPKKTEAKPETVKTEEK